MDETLLLSISIAGAVTMLVLWAFKLVLKPTDERLRDRLTVGNPAASSHVDRGAAPTFTRDNAGGAAAISGVMPLFQRIGIAAAQPFMPKKRDTQSALRKKLGQA